MLVGDPLQDYFAHLDSLAPEGYNFGFHIRYSRPKLVRITYDKTWSESYAREKYILCDPAVIWPLTNDGACRWSELDLPDPLGVLRAAEEHGCSYGVAIGTGPAASRTLGSCGRSDREFTDQEIGEITEVIESIHSLTESKGELKHHQAEALEGFEAGKSYEEICRDLGISRTALKNRLNGARRALGVHTNVEAVRVALERGVIRSTSYTGIIQGLPPGDV